MFVLYTSIKTSQEFLDIKYTKDKNAFMDVYVEDIDDSLVPTAPEDILEKVSELNVEQNKQDEEEKVKTTHKKVDQAKPTSKPQNQEEVKPKDDFIPEPSEKKLEEEVKKESSLLDLFSNLDSNKFDDATKAEDDG